MVWCVRGVLIHPLEPVIGLAEGETRWRVMTAGVLATRVRDLATRCDAPKLCMIYSPA